MKHLPLILALLLLSGCPSANVNPYTANVNATGGALQKTSAYIGAADAATKAAQPHADATGKALLDVVMKNHATAQSTLADGVAALARVQADEQKQAANAAKLTAQNVALAHSWGYRSQLWIVRFLKILLLIIALHYACALLAIFLPPPYSSIASFIAKLTNVPGWSTWLLMYVEKKRAVSAALASAPVVGSVGTLITASPGLVK